MLRKKWLSLLVAISMVAAMFPATVFAAPTEDGSPDVEIVTEAPAEKTGEEEAATTETKAVTENEETVEDEAADPSGEDKSVAEGTEEATGETETPAEGTEEKAEEDGETASEEAGPGEETAVVPPVTTPEVTETPVADNGIATMAETRTEYPFKIGETGYATLADAVKEVSEGETIKLTQDLDDAPGVSVPAGKNFTLDFGSHIYTLKNPGAGSTGTETNGFQLLSGSTITFKNGTIRISEENGNGDGKPIKRVIQNYADLTLEDMQIYAEHQYGSQDYVLSLNNGKIIFKGNTSIYTTDPEAIAFDVCYWEDGGYNGTYVTFEDDYSGTIGGTIVYDSTDKEKGTLTIKGSGNFVGIETSESSSNGVTIKISGGTFKNSFPAEYLAGNVALKERADGTFMVGEATPVAKIGENTYSTLEAAVEAAESGSTIVLLEDVYLGKMLTLDKANVKLDLNECTISASVDFVDPTNATNNDNHLIDVTADGVTITNGTLKAGTLNNHTLNIWSADGVTLEKVTLDGSAAGMDGAPLIVGASNVTLKGNIELKTGEKSWYGMNVDSREVSGADKGASLTLDSAKVSVTGSNPIGIYVENTAGDKVALNFQGAPTIAGEAEGFVPVQYAVDKGTGAQDANATLNFETNNDFDISDCGFGATLTVSDGDNLTTTGFNSFEDAFAYVNNNPNAENPYIILYEDVELNEMLVIDRDDLTINLANKTIKASESFEEKVNKNDNHLIDVRANNVSFVAGTLQAGKNNNHVLNLWKAHGVRLDGVTLDGSAAGIEGAPLVLGASDVTLAGWVRFVQGPNSWYAVNLDSKGEPAVASTLGVEAGKTTVIFDKAGQNNEGIVIDNGANADGMKVDLTGAKISVVNNEEPYTFKVIKYGKNSEDKPMTDEEKAKITVVAPALSQWPDDNYYIVDVNYNEEESSGSSHEHSYVWQGSPDEHWQYCTDCGQVVGNGAHTFQWKDCGQVCSVCGYKVTETSTAAAPAAQASAPAAAAPAAPAAPAAAAIPQTGDASNPMLWVVLLAVSGSALGALVYTKKKREE